MIREDSFLSSILQLNSYLIDNPDQFYTEYFINHNATLKNGFYTLKIANSLHNYKLLNKFQKKGFNLVDINMSFSSNKQDIMKFCKSLKEKFNISPALPHHSIQIQEIASTTLQSNRFFYDENISNGKAEAIKANWAKNYFEGKRGNELFIIEHDGVEAFLLLIHDKPQNTWIIDLIATKASAQGKGMASSLIYFFASEILGSDETIKVGTSINNVSALNFYSKNGFKYLSSHFYLHLHQL